MNIEAVSSAIDIFGMRNSNPPGKVETSIHYLAPTLRLYLGNSKQYPSAQDQNVFP